MLEAGEQNTASKKIDKVCEDVHGQEPGGPPDPQPPLDPVTSGSRAADGSLVGCVTFVISFVVNRFINTKHENSGARMLFLPGYPACPDTTRPWILSYFVLPTLMLRELSMSRS